MDVYLNRTLELGQKIPYGASDVQLQLSHHTYFVGNPSRLGASFPVKLLAGVYCSQTEVLNLVAEVQPATKAHALGYVFKFESGIGPHEPDRILAYMGADKSTGLAGLAQGATVGELSYHADGAYLQDQDVQVAEEHQRRGIATAMYQQAEALTGKQFLSRLGEVMPVDAAAFWASPDRPFGVDALYAQPRRQLWVNLADLLPAPLRRLPRVEFDAGRFAQSHTGQRCIETANSGGGPRVGLQDARIRGLMAKGHDGKVDAFVSDPSAPPKLLRGVAYAQPVPTLTLSNGKGLPDVSISPPLAALTPASREAVLQFMARQLHAMADLDALESLHPQVRLLERLRTVHHEQGSPTTIERAFEIRRNQAISVMTDMLEQEAEFRASQL
jgi:GNAT superfamily N-acetyltransferase